MVVGLTAGLSRILTIASTRGPTAAGVGDVTIGVTGVSTGGGVGSGVLVCPHAETPEPNSTARITIVRSSQFFRCLYRLECLMSMSHFKTLLPGSWLIF